MPETYTKSFGFTDTKAATPLEVEVPQVDYVDDWTVETQNGSECVLTNVTSPVDQPYRTRFSIQRIANVYTGTDIDPVTYGPIKRGWSLLVGSQLTLRITNSTTGEYVDYPVTVNTTVKWPVTSGIDADDIRTALNQNAGMFYDGGTTNARLNELLRRAFRPNGI
jgi:hypothetical protein